MRKKTIIIIAGIGLLAAALAAFVGLGRGLGQEADTGEYQTVTAERAALNAQVGATGVVRANQTAVLTWATSGQVEAIGAAAGELVEPNRVLASLAQSSLPQNVILAEADLVSSQKALDDLLASQSPQAHALQALEDARTALDNLAVNASLAQAQAQVELADARDALEDAEYRWRVQQEGYRASGDTIAAAEANLVLAEQEVEAAQKAFNRVSGRAADDPVRALALSSLVAAKNQRDAVLRSLNWYTGEPTDIDQALLDAEVASAQARLADAEAAWVRVKDGPSEADIAEAEALLADAQREWERVKDGPNGEDIAAAEARVAAAQATLDTARVEAPFAGTVTIVENTAGDQVSPGSVAFRLDDLSRLLIDVDVSEVDINQIEAGQPVIMTFDAVLGKEYRGEVVEVARVGTDLQGVVNFTVTVELMDPDESVRPGMTAAVNILVSEKEDVLVVPNRAVRLVDGSRVVYILDDSGEPVKVEVILGATADSVSEVVGGELREGDLVILNPPSELEFGPGSGPPPGFGGS